MNKALFPATAPFEEARKYWTSKLSGQLHAVDLWSDYRPTATYEEGVYTGVLDNETVENLLRISRNNDLSQLVVLTAALKTALMKITGQQDVIVAVPTYAAFGAEDYNRCIVFRDFIHIADTTFKELALSVNETVTEGYKNQHYPLENIILEIENVLSLFNVSLILDSLHKEDSATVMAEEFKSNFILEFRKKEHPFDLRIRYNAHRFKPETVQRYCEAILFVLAQALRNPAVTIADIQINTPQELDKLLNLFNDTDTPFPEDHAMHRLFEEQAQQTPDNIALIVPGPDHKPLQTLTYQELNEKADLLAAWLREKGVTPSSVVGLKVEDPLLAATGILGILKSSAAYLPLDPDYPQERIDYMLADTAASIVIEQDANSRFKLTDFIGSIRPSSPIRPIGPINPTAVGNTAYVVYTSGTTGRPKGVPITHQGIVNYVCWRKHTYGCGAEDITLQLLSYAFDGFNSNFYTALISGGVLVMPTKAKRMDFDYIRSVIRVNAVTNTSLVPGMYEALLRDARPEDLQSLRFVVLAGEKAGEKLIETSNKRIPKLLLINEYGPSEAAVTAVANVGMTADNAGIIGRPIANVNIYILNDSMTPVPIGGIGELCITGPGVTSGYINNPDLNNKKFALSPKQKRLYKTGDLARWLPDGCIEIAGRLDQQTKIRGFRIEPAEIENRLKVHPAVKEAAVTVNKAPDSDENYLSAYLVTAGNITLPALKKFLALELPDYMIPRYFIQIDEIPLTVNGKIDRAALPAPEGTERQSENPYVEPQSLLEKSLAAIWKEILNSQQVGINDNFFEIGGHSLKAVIMTSKIHKTFNVKISLEQIFSYPTITQLCRFIQEAAEDKFIALQPAPKMDYYPLSPAQRGIYIQYQKDPAGLAYNMSQVLTVRGPLEKDKVESIFHQLIQRHESFRTSFTVIDGEPVQQIHETAPFKLEYYESTRDEAPKIVTSFIRPFDLTRAPLLRAGLIKLEPTLHVWMFDMHHTIYDGTSVALFINQFMTLYNGDVPLPPLPLQYKDYSHWFYSPQGQEAMQEQRRYWLKHLVAPLPRPYLPLDFPRLQLQQFDGSNVATQLPEEETRKLLELAGIEQVTLFMILLTPFYILLAKLSGCEDIIIGTPVAGRRHDDLQSIIGVFANNLALRGFPVETKSAVEFLREIRRNVLEAFENQEFPFETLVTEISTSRDFSRNPIYDVEFVLQNIALENSHYVSHDAPQFHLEPFEKTHTTSHFDLLLSAAYKKNVIELNFEFAVALFKPETVEKFAAYYLEIIRQILDNPRILISSITLSHDFAETDTSASSALQDEWLM